MPSFGHSSIQLHIGGSSTVAGIIMDQFHLYDLYIILLSDINLITVKSGKDGPWPSAITPRITIHAAAYYADKGWQGERRHWR